MDAFVLIVIVGGVIVLCLMGLRPDQQARKPAPPSNNNKVPSKPYVVKKPANSSRPSGPLPDMPANLTLVGKAYVIDGDTIIIRKTKIRLAGIDAPEIDMPWGQKSKWAMVAICKGQTITVKLDGERSFDRLVGTCFLPDGRDIGAEIVKMGLALDLPVK